MTLPRIPFARSWLAPLAVLVALAGAAVPTQAQRRDSKVGAIGAAEIWRVDEGGVFDRCFAKFPGPGGGARIFFTKDRQYVLTAPSVPNPLGLLTLAVDTPRGIIGLDARFIGNAHPNRRAVAPFTGDQGTQMLEIRNAFTFTVDTRSFRYPLGGVTMERIFVAVEDCTNRLSGFRR